MMPENCECEVQYLGIFIVLRLTESLTTECILWDGTLLPLTLRDESRQNVPFSTPLVIVVDLRVFDGEL